MKKIILACVVLLLVLIAIPSAMAVATKCGTNLTWSYNSSAKKLTISGSGEMYDYTESSMPWKNYASSIETLEIGEGATRIGNNAFRGLSKLSSISLPTSLRSIGDYAFYGIGQGLSGIDGAITLPDGLTSIGTYAFSNSKVSNIVFPDSVTSIGTGCFADCKGLNYITLPSGLTAIPDEMFKGCNCVLEMSLPDSITQIGASAFESFAMPSRFLDLPAELRTIGANAFKNMYQGTFILPSKVTTIGQQAFYQDQNNAYSLVSVLIPDSVTSLPSQLFNIPGNATVLIHDGYALENQLSGCTLIKVDSDVNLSQIESFGQYYGTLFYYYLASGKLVFFGSGGIPGSQFRSWDSLTEVEIQISNFTGFGISAFEGCTNLRSVTVPNTLGTIRERAFYGCTNLRSINISNSSGGTGTARIYADSIEDYAFYKCKALTNIDVRAESIGKYAFGYCTGLLSAMCSNSQVDKVPEGLFQGCGELTTVSLPGIEEIEEYGFDLCYELSKLDIVPADESYTGVKIVRTNAFRECSKLGWFFIPDTMTTIEANAFAEKTVLLKQNGSSIDTGSYVTLEMPAEVTDASCITGGGYCGTNAVYYIIGNTGGENSKKLTISGTGEINTNAFGSNKSFNRLVIGEGITSIGNSAFYDTVCYEVTLPASMRTIGKRAFYNCSSLETLNWQDGIMTIDEYAFYNHKLGTINLPETVRSIGNLALYTSTYLSLIRIPGSVKTLGRNAFGVGSPNITRNTTVLYSKDSCYNSYSNNGGTSNATSIPVESEISVYDPIEYGKCGTSAYYYITSGKALYVTGTGAIQDYAFYYMDNSSMTGKVRVSTLGTQLTAVTIGEGITHVGEFCFRCDENIASVVLPESLQSMGREAFSGILYLSSIQFPQHDFTAGDHLFYNALLDLESVTLPEGLTKMPASMFSSCKNLTSIYIPSTVTEIETYALSGTGLTSVELPEGLTNIGGAAFYGVPLTEVTLPASLTSMESSAFTNCSSLNRAVFRGSIPEDTLSDTYGTAFESSTADIWVPHGTAVWTEGKLGANNTVHYYCPQDETNMATFAAVSSERVEPTCTENGHESYFYCAECGMIFTDVTASAQASQDDYAIPATGHSYVDAPVLTFAADGSACTAAFACKHGDNTVEIPMTVTSEVETPAGCLTKGKTLYTATLEIDGDVTVDGETVSLPAGTYTKTLLVEDIDALGHDPQPVASVEATCTETGLTEGSVCARCKEVLVPQSVIPAMGHSYDDEPVLTFAADGSACMAAFACKHGDNTVEVPMTVTSEVDTPAGCLTKGKTLYTATLEIDGDVTVDGETVSLPAGTYTKTLLVEDIEALGHNPQTVASVEATCTETGLTEGSVCARCKDVLVQQSVIPATGHSYVDEPVLTFEADGSACTATFTCVHEDHSVTVQAEVSSEVSVPAKCLENGKTLYTATLEISGDVTVDGETVSLPDGTYTETMELEDIPAKGHTEVTIPGIEPTCTEPGTLDYIFCKVCKAVLQEDSEIPPLGHKDAVTIEALQPTCTEAGHTEEHQCSVCHEILTASQTIPATGHHYGEPVFCWSEDGTTCQVSFGCEKEDDTQTMEAEVTSEVTLDPSCTEVGSKVYTATVEFGGKEYSEAGEPVEVPATGHTPVTDAAVAPTDRESGLTEGSHCGVCGASLKGQETIPALWSYSEDGLTAIAYNGTASEVTIPEGVTALGDELFMDNISVTSVLVPKEVTAVGTYTFYGTSGMTDIYLPDNLTGIQATTFFGTTARLHTSAGGSTARQISYRENAFTDGAWTLQFKRMNEPTEIYLLGWEGTDETLVIPESFGGVALKAIRSNAFDGMSQVKQITVPESVTVIADDAFNGCSEELTVVSAYDAYARTWALANEVKWEHDQHIPEAVEGVPATYTKPGLTAGSVCAECGEVLEEQEEIPALDTSTLKTLKLPTGLTEIEDEAFEGGAFEAVIIPDGCMHIGHKAFMDCAKLVYVSYPAGAEFEEDAFVGCGEIEFEKSAGAGWVVDSD